MKHRAFSMACSGLLAACLLSAPAVQAMPSGSDGGGSSPQAVVLAQATRHDRLLSIAFHGDYGIAVGEAGRVMVSSNGGESWSKKPAPTPLELMDVATDGTHSIIVGEMGLILIGSEKGPWHKVDSGTHQRLLSVSLNDKGVAFAIGAFGVLLKSTDNGQTWQSAAPDWKPLYNNTGPMKSIVPISRPTNYVVKVFNDGSVVIGGEYGEILRSPDLGKSWNLAYRFPKTRASQVPPTVFGMHIGKDGTGYAVGQAGLILKTVDYGKSWTKLDVPAADGNLLFAVDTYPNGRINIVGMRMVLSSRDGGQSWKRINGLDFDLSWYNDISHPSTNASTSEPSILVGNGARIVRLASGQ